MCLCVFEKQTLDGGSKLRMTTANTNTHTHDVGGEKQKNIGFRLRCDNGRMAK